MTTMVLVSFFEIRHPCTSMATLDIFLPHEEPLGVTPVESPKLSIPAPDGWVLQAAADWTGAYADSLTATARTALRFTPTSPPCVRLTLLKPRAKKPMPNPVGWATSMLPSLRTEIDRLVGEERRAIWERRKAETSNAWTRAVRSLARARWDRLHDYAAKDCNVRERITAIHAEARARTGELALTEIGLTGDERARAIGVFQGTFGQLAPKHPQEAEFEAAFVALLDDTTRTAGALERLVFSEGPLPLPEIPGLHKRE